MFFDIGKRSFEFRLSEAFFWRPLRGHEVVANYIEHYNYWLWFALIVRIVGVDRSNLEKLGEK